MVLPVHQRFTFEDYLVLEETSTVKHEFSDGYVWAMAGGTPDHGALAANVIALLASQLRERPCRIFTSDVRIRVKATGLATYPDVSVVCGKQQSDPDDPKGNTLINPSLIVEVLSPSTEDYDRGEKLSHYQQLPGLREVLIASHREPKLTVYRREGADWTARVAGPGESLPLASIGGVIAVDEVYRDEFRR
jgi:Uma2 family endonuclease